MWIEIQKNIFEESEFKGLNYLFQILSWYPDHSIPRYNVFINLDEIRSTENYFNFKKVEKDFDVILQQQFDDFVTFSKKKAQKDYLVSLNNANSVPKIFSIEEAIRFFNQPVSIILENNKNDAYFIMAIIYHFDKEGKVKEHLKNGWIKFENAGGCSNVANFIEGELKKFEDLAARNNKNTFDYFRGMVILDSDKETLEMPIKPQYQNLVNDLNSKNMNQNRHHILEKRMMENYMPEEVFDEIIGSDEILKKLTNNITNNKRELKSWIRDYQNFSVDQKDFKKYFENLDKNLKTSFPIRFIESQRVNKQTLKKRANSDELERILDKIIQLL